MRSLFYAMRGVVHDLFWRISVVAEIMFDPIISYNNAFERYVNEGYNRLGLFQKLWMKLINLFGSNDLYRYPYKLRNKVFDEIKDNLDILKAYYVLHTESPLIYVSGNDFPITVPMVQAKITMSMKDIRDNPLWATKNIKNHTWKVIKSTVERTSTMGSGVGQPLGLMHSTDNLWSLTEDIPAYEGQIYGKVSEAIGEDFYWMMSKKTHNLCMKVNMADGRQLVNNVGNRVMVGKDILYVDAIIEPQIVAIANNAYVMVLPKQFFLKRIDDDDNVNFTINARVSGRLEGRCGVLSISGVLDKNKEETSSETE